MAAASRPALNRFIVMGVLQAARARSLGLPLDSAYSWGLNRAIFYAAAKQGFLARRSPRPTTGTPAEERRKRAKEAAREPFAVGEEVGYRARVPGPIRFTIGGTIQTPEGFERQVIRRFGSRDRFDRAWAEARHLMDEFDLEVLRSPRKFYSEVYRPRRDRLVEAWSRSATETEPIPA